MDLVAWTDGRALIATGSPFDPVPHGAARSRSARATTSSSSRASASAILVSEAKEVTDGMFAVAAQRLADEVKESDLASGSLFPSTHEIRRVSARIAEAVVTEARDSGVGRQIPDAEIPKAVAAAMWDPAYLPMVPAPTKADMPCALPGPRVASFSRMRFQSARARKARAPFFPRQTRFSPPAAPSGRSRAASASCRT